MREKLQTLPLTQLRELAKAQGLKGVTTLKKADVYKRQPLYAGRAVERGRQAEDCNYGKLELPAGTQQQPGFLYKAL